MLLWLIPVLLILILGLMVCAAGRAAQPITDRERYYFNGEPTRCITCGRAMRWAHAMARDGYVVTTVRCPMYSGDGSACEFYRWIDKSDGE